MNDLSISHVNTYMVNIAAAGIEQQISWFYIADRNFFSSGSLISGASACADTEMREYTHNKAGAVRSLCKTGTSIYIRIP